MPIDIGHRIATLGMDDEQAMAAYRIVRTAPLEIEVNHRSRLVYLKHGTMVAKTLLPRSRHTLVTVRNLILRTEMRQ